jgi:hypothetical protein
MNRNCRAAACEGIHLRRVGELFGCRPGGPWLQELAESRACIRKPPTRELNSKAVEGVPQSFLPVGCWIHAEVSLYGTVPGRVGTVVFH